MIDDLQNQKRLIPLLAAWHLAEWPDVPGLPADRAELLLSRSSENIPKTFIAFVANKPAGFASLTVCNLAERPEITPWLTSLYVDEAARGQGVGQRLIDFCLRHAAGMGFPCMYLHTTEAPDYYRRLGWTEIERIGAKVVFSKQC